MFRFLSYPFDFWNDFQNLSVWFPKLEIPARHRSFCMEINGVCMELERPNLYRWKLFTDFKRIRIRSSANKKFEYISQRPFNLSAERILLTCHSVWSCALPKELFNSAPLIWLQGGVFCTSFPFLIAFFRKPTEFAVPSAEPLNGKGLAEGTMACSICLTHGYATHWRQGGTRFAFPINFFPRLDRTW